MEEWFLLDTGESSPEYNMALDEALLSFSFKNNTPILRFINGIRPLYLLDISRKQKLM